MEEVGQRKGREIHHNIIITKSPLIYAKLNFPMQNDIL